MRAFYVTGNLRGAEQPDLTAADPQQELGVAATSEEALGRSSEHPVMVVDLEGGETEAVSLVQRLLQQERVPAIVVLQRAG